MDLDGRRGVPWRSLGILLVILILALLRVMHSWSYHAQTIDEDWHLAAGLEWIRAGTYRVETGHPPLSRVVFSIVPALLQREPPTEQPTRRWGNDFLFRDGRYQRNLVLMRMGNLPWLFGSVILTWWLGRKYFGEWAGVLGAGILANDPTFLGHSALATTDGAAVFAFLALCLAFWGWLEKPSNSRMLLLCGALVLGVLAKFSVVAYFGVAGPSMFLLYRLRRGRRWGPAHRRNYLKGLVIAPFVVSLGVWAGYRFSFGSICSSEELPGVVRQCSEVLRSGLPGNFLFEVLTDLTYPFPELFNGLIKVLEIGREGPAPFFMGTRGEPSIFFYPVAFGLKTPLAFQLLLVGSILLFLDRIRRGVLGAWPLVVMPILVVWGFALSSGINLGIRHLLPSFPFLSIVAGWGCCETVRRFRNAPSRVAVGLALAWLFLSSMRGQPDNLAFFNPIAGDRPEAFLVDSNLDWGQDILRLKWRVEEREIPALSLAFFGSARVREVGIPAELYPLLPNEAPKAVWVAISVTLLQGLEGYEWLKKLEPEERVGTSILLYRLERDRSPRW